MSLKSWIRSIPRLIYHVAVSRVSVYAMASVSLVSMVCQNSPVVPMVAELAPQLEHQFVLPLLLQLVHLWEH